LLNATRGKIELNLDDIAPRAHATSRASGAPTTTIQNW